MPVLFPLCKMSGPLRRPRRLFIILNMLPSGAEGAFLIFFEYLGPQLFCWTEACLGRGSGIAKKLPCFEHGWRDWGGRELGALTSVWSRHLFLMAHVVLFRTMGRHLNQNQAAKN